MPSRRSEDVEIPAMCHNSDCDMSGLVILVSGRFAADGEFEAHDENDLSCSSCDKLLDLELE